MELLREMEILRDKSSRIKVDFKARMKVIIAEVLNGIGVLTGRLGFACDPDYARSRVKELELLNKRLSVENNNLKEENIQLLGKLNRKDRREVKFKERNTDYRNDENEINESMINDSNKNKSKNFSREREDFPPLKQKTFRNFTSDNTDTESNRKMRSLGHHNDADTDVDNNDALKRELLNKNRRFTKEIEKLSAEKRQIEYKLDEVKRNRRGDRNRKKNFRNLKQPDYDRIQYKEKFSVSSGNNRNVRNSDMYVNNLRSDPVNQNRNVSRTRKNSEISYVSSCDVRSLEVDSEREIENYYCRSLPYQPVHELFLCYQFKPSINC